MEKYNKSVMREAEENRKKELETKEEEALRLKETKDKEEKLCGYNHLDWKSG